jgi:hypothetical protein
MSDATPRRWVWAPAVAALAAHIASLRNGFALDDEVLILHNPYVRTVEGLGTMLRSSLFVASANPLATDYYRPCASLLNWVSWQIFADGRAGQHAINVALHVGICLLLASLLRRHRLRADISAIAATLFALHPATVELVAYVGGRQDMLGWIFALGAWRLMLSCKRRWQVAAVAAAGMILATFSREAFLAVVCLLPVAAAFGDDGSFDRQRGGSATAGILAGFAIVAGIRHLVGVAWSQPRDPHTVGEWLSTAAAILLRSGKNLVAPTDLAVDLVPYMPPTWLAVVVLTGCVAIVALGLRKCRKEHRALAAVGGLGLLTLTAVHTPVALIFGHTNDRYTYPYLICTTLLLAPLAARGVERLAPSMADSPLRPLLRVLPWVFAVLLLPVTLSRVMIWRDELSLQKQMYLDRPDDPMAKFAEAKRLMQLGDCAGALPLCEAYVEYFPRTTRADICLGHCYLAVGEPERAIEPLSRYSKRFPDRATSRQALLGALFHLGRLDEVEELIDAWGPAFASEPDVVAAKRELDHLRAQGHRSAQPSARPSARPAPPAAPTGSK